MQQLLLRGPPKGSAAFCFFSTLLWALAVKLFVVSAKGVATDGTERQTDRLADRQGRRPRQPIVKHREKMSGKTAEGRK